MQSRRRPVVLMVAEAVTLAHFARIAALADALDPASYDVVVASDPRFLDLGSPMKHPVHRLESIPSSAFASALAAGKPLYDVDTLARYVEDDMALIGHVGPDLVVGDFRLSLAVSGPASRVPYAAVVNAYWSPHAAVDFPVPDLPLTRTLGVPVAQALFDIARPLAFARHARPLNRLRRRYGMSALGGDLRTTYSAGDYTLYADIPDYVPMRRLPPTHRYLGAPLWSTRLPLPDWWDRLPVERPVVVVTLGSSGSGHALPAILDVLARRPVTVIAASAGHADIGNVPSNVFVAAYVPLDAAIERASLLVCNGGSLSTYQALHGGVPILGLCTNMDQLLNMRAVERLGAGIMLRAADFKPDAIAKTVAMLVDTPSYRQAAARAGERVRATDPRRTFARFVSDVLG